MNIYDNHFKVADQLTGDIVAPEEGMQIIAESKQYIGEGVPGANEDGYIEYNSLTDPVTGEKVFNLAKYKLYFDGENTIKVLGGKDTYEDALNAIKNNKTDLLIDGTDITYTGLVHYQDNPYAEENEGVAVWGLPLLGLEDGNADFSHIELRNSLMSHQNYRNWGTFMEAELALFQDLGYDIDRSKFFGKSYYLNNIEEENNISYNGEVDYGIGMHIYGDSNKITQAADIQATGDASIGARIDGVNNSYTVGENTKIEMLGNNNLGIAVTYGKGHNITIEQGAEVSATGENGIAASFDFGKNILGEKYEHRGSYIYSQIDDSDDSSEVLNSTADLDEHPELQGALVEKFDIKGSLIGEKAAIYISDNAYVENINVFDGATISGDIISEWNSMISGDVGAIVQHDDFLITNKYFSSCY